MFKFLKQTDKKKHFGLGFLISWGAAWIAFTLWADFIILSAILVPFILSIIWELIHLYRSKFNWEDIYAAMVGALIATLIWLGILLTNPDWVGVLNNLTEKC